MSEEKDRMKHEFVLKEQALQQAHQETITLNQITAERDRLQHAVGTKGQALKQQAQTVQEKVQLLHEMAAERDKAQQQVETSKVQSFVLCLVMLVCCLCAESDWCQEHAFQLEQELQRLQIQTTPLVDGLQQVNIPIPVARLFGKFCIPFNTA